MLKPAMCLCVFAFCVCDFARCFLAHAKTDKNRGLKNGRYIWRFKLHTEMERFVANEMLWSILRLCSESEIDGSELWLVKRGRV